MGVSSLDVFHINMSTLCVGIQSNGLERELVFLVGYDQRGRGPGGLSPTVKWFPVAVSTVSDYLDQYKGKRDYFYAIVNLEQLRIAKHTCSPEALFPDLVYYKLSGALLEVLSAKKSSYRSYELLMRHELPCGEHLDAMIVEGRLPRSSQPDIDAPEVVGSHQISSQSKKASQVLEPSDEVFEPSDEAVCEVAAKLFMKKAKSLTKLAERIEDAMIELSAIRDRVFNIQDSLLDYTNQFELMSERDKPHQDQ